MRPLIAALAAGALLAGLVPAEHGVPAAAGAAAPSVTVGGGADMYPAYSTAISRYAVHPAPDGSVRVDVGGDAPVWFDGVPDADGSTTVAATRPGQEISVFVGSGAQRRALSLHVLPSGFPTLAATATGGSLAAGDVALTLDRYDGSSPRFEAVVDRHGVPVWTRLHRERVLDLKMNANGHLTVHRPTTTPGRTGGALVELDERFEEVRRVETTGLENTDDHDSLLLPDGTRWLTAYEPNRSTGLVDSVIQHVAADGTVLWQWTSAPVADETVVPGEADYAHLNSIDVQPNGDVLASFRHLSSVFLIRPGSGGDEVVWKLGGRDSSFTFPPLPDGEPDVGTCAQHSASLLPDGRVLVFDNGSTPFFGALCVDQQDPWGPPVDRPSTRVVEFTLADGVATPHVLGDTSRFAWFMGSAARTPVGTTLVGWSADTRSIATELDAGGLTTWDLRDTTAPVDGVVPRAYISYRAALVPARDGFDPEVRLDGPDDGATVALDEDVPVTFSCSDRGGSTLQSCDGPEGRRLDTSVPGSHTWSVSARDGAGRTTTRTRTYVVAAAPSPPPVVATDPTTPSSPSGPTPTPTPPPVGSTPTAPSSPAAPALAMRAAGRPWRPVARVVARRGTDRTVRAVLRVRNDGGSAGRFVVRGPRSLAAGSLTVTYARRGTSLTRAVAGRGWRTPRLGPGESLLVRMVVHVDRDVQPGRHRVRVAARARAGERASSRLDLVLR